MAVGAFTDFDDDIGHMLVDLLPGSYLVICPIPTGIGRNRARPSTPSRTSTRAWWGASSSSEARAGGVGVGPREKPGSRRQPSDESVGCRVGRPCVSSSRRRPGTGDGVGPPASGVELADGVGDVDGEIPGGAPFGWRCRPGRTRWHRWAGRRRRQRCRLRRSPRRPRGHRRHPHWVARPLDWEYQV